MRSIVEIARMAAVVAVVALFSNMAVADPVPEPSGLWSGPMHGETPETLSGARVLDLAALEVLMARKPLLLDVGPADRKPDDFPKDGLWLPTHRSMPGAVWMPGAGAASLEDAQEKMFYRRIEALTQKDKRRPIVTFCRPQCWGSWNVGKRLVMKGYTNVGWFPAGIDGWQEKHETAVVKPEAGWSTEAPK
jgi:PQQ-dependent catabolism-associated CXXCW motif protein